MLQVLGNGPRRLTSSAIGVVLIGEEAFEDNGGGVDGTVVLGEGMQRSRFAAGETLGAKDEGLRTRGTTTLSFNLCTHGSRDVSALRRRALTCCTARLSFWPSKTAVATRFPSPPLYRDKALSISIQTLHRSVWNVRPHAVDNKKTSNNKWVEAGVGEDGSTPVCEAVCESSLMAGRALLFSHPHSS